MTLREIIASNPDLFRTDQYWYQDESFLEHQAKEIPVPSFEQWSFYYLFPKQDKQRVSAATLALCYVKNPNAKVWENYLWTDDMDAEKQRVYIGKNNGLMEIHRHLQITPRWGLPCFQ